MKLLETAKLATLALALTIGAGSTARVARADDDEKKKTEKDLKKAEENQGNQGNGQGQAKKLDDAFGENPLPKIIELMKQVEEKLADTETGAPTQAEQKKIVDALKLGGKAKSALDDFIKKIEDMQGD